MLTGKGFYAYDTFKLHSQWFVHSRFDITHIIPNLAQVKGRGKATCKYKYVQTAQLRARTRASLNTEKAYHYKRYKQENSSHNWRCELGIILSNLQGPNIPLRQSMHGRKDKMTAPRALGHTEHYLLRAPPLGEAPCSMFKNLTHHLTKIGSCFGTWHIFFLN